jgi:hypothetical protein
MKNIRNKTDDLRPEYKRSDFGEMAQGKYARAQVDFTELVRLILTCIGEDEGFQFTHHAVSSSLAVHQRGDWTYEIDDANQITLFYWLDQFDSVEEPISNLSVITPEDRSEIQSLLLNHVRTLKEKVRALQ